MFRLQSFFEIFPSNVVLPYYPSALNKMTKESLTRPDSPVSPSEFRQSLGNMEASATLVKVTPNQFLFQF